MEKRISKMLAIMFAMALALAYSCGGGGGGGGGAAGYTPDNALSTQGTTTLSTAQKTQVEQEVSAYVQALGGAFSATSKAAATTFSQCYDEPVGECSSGRYCVEASGSGTSGHVKVWMDQSLNCGGMNIYFWEFDEDYTVSGSQYTATSSAGAIDFEYEKGTSGFDKALRIFIKWDKGGAVEGWVGEDGVKTATIGGTTSDPTVTWL